MDAIVDYFETIPSFHRSAILIGGIMLFWLIEGSWPLFSFKYNKWRHAGVNFFFTLTTVLVNLPLAFLFVKTSDWAAAKNFGIMQGIAEFPLWMKTLTGLFFLDLIGAWLAHWTQHKVKWMWQFHIVHHADMQVDTTTANRHHPGESIIRFTFAIFAIAITGAPMWLVFLYQSLSVVMAQFNHANIVLNPKLDSILSSVIVTPNMHHVHHHHMQPYTDSNYGNIFSVWDHLFETFRTLNQRDIVYGLDTYPHPSENAHIKSLLYIPFQKYRPPLPHDATPK